MYGCFLYLFLKALCYKPGIDLFASNINRKCRFYVAFKLGPKVRLIETVMHFLQFQSCQGVFQKSNKAPQRVVPFGLTQVYLVILEIFRHAGPCFNAEPALPRYLCVYVLGIKLKFSITYPKKYLLSSDY